MAIIFYPYSEDLEVGTQQEKIEVLLEAAQRYKAAVLDSTTAKPQEANAAEKKRLTPRDLAVAFNWDELAKLFREIREAPEASPPTKNSKAAALTKLAEVYEVLRGAKMPKLEAVRLALVNEANQLRGGSSQVA